RGQYQLEESLARVISVAEVWRELHDVCAPEQVAELHGHEKNEQQVHDPESNGYLGRCKPRLRYPGNGLQRSVTYENGPKEPCRQPCEYRDEQQVLDERLDVNTEDVLNYSGEYGIG